jgi:hypothetical protein
MYMALKLANFKLLLHVFVHAITSELGFVLFQT